MKGIYDMVKVEQRKYIKKNCIFTKFIAYPITYKSSQYYVEVIFDRSLWKYTARIFKYRQKKVFIFGYKSHFIKEFRVYLGNSCTNLSEFEANLYKVMTEIFEQYTSFIMQESKLKENEKEMKNFLQQWDGKI